MTERDEMDLPQKLMLQTALRMGENMMKQDKICSVQVPTMKPIE